MTKQLAQAQQDLTLAEAQRDDLKQKCGATEEELKSSADKARGVTALQKELSEYQEKEKTLKKSLTQMKESEQVSSLSLKEAYNVVFEDSVVDCQGTS